MRDHYQVGRALKLLRRESGLEVEDLGLAMGKSPEEVLGWEERGLRPTRKEMEDALRALGSDLGALAERLERLEIEDL